MGPHIMAPGYGQTNNIFLPFLNCHFMYWYLVSSYSEGTSHQVNVKTFLQLASSVEVLQSNLDTLGHGLLTLTNPDAGVEELLVGLVLTVGVTDSGQEVVLLVEHVVTDTGHVGELHVSVKVDLDNTVADSLLVLLLGRAGATVEDKEDGLVRGGVGLLLDVGLVLLEKLGVETDVAGLVDTVHITETSGNGEVGADGSKGVVDGKDVLGLSVQGVVVNILVVDTILLTTGDTDFLNRVSRRSYLVAMTVRHTISSHCFMGAARLR